jgi:hypothetical protein
MDGWVSGTSAIVNSQFDISLSAYTRIASAYKRACLTRLFFAILLVRTYTQQNAKEGVNQACIAAHEATNDQWMCMFAEHSAVHIKHPVFAMQSQCEFVVVQQQLSRVF